MDEREAILAHLAAVEAVAMGCLTILLASMGNDPDLSGAKRLLDTMNTETQQGWSHLSEAQRKASAAVLTDMLNRVMSNAAALRGIGAEPLQ